MRWSEGVMRPLTPMMSAPIFSAVSRIVAAGTMTPRSVTSKPLQVRTMAVMFLPMSCTSPWTVAMRNFGLPPTDSSLSMKGSSTATASRMMRADLTTWGRNILPSAKSSPTRSIPDMSGPSMTATALPSLSRQESVSSFRLCDKPLTTAFESLSSGSATASETVVRTFWGPLSASISEAFASSLEVASGSLSKMTSSTACRSPGSMSS